MKLKIAVFSFWISALACVEYNTATPQASSSVDSSKEIGAFLSIGRLIRPGASNIVNSVWLEKVWKYETVKGKRRVELQSNSQIVIQFSASQDSFKKEDYLTKWELTDEKMGVFGSGNGVFMLRINNMLRVDTLHLLIRQIPSGKTFDLGTFDFQEK